MLIDMLNFGVRCAVREFGKCDIGVNGGCDRVTLVHLIPLKYLCDVLDLCEADGIFGASDFHPKEPSDLSEFF